MIVGYMSTTVAQNPRENKVVPNDLSHFQILLSSGWQIKWNMSEPRADHLAAAIRLVSFIFHFVIWRWLLY
jgi:hypothetical protein